MATRADWIPKRAADFNNKQDTYFARVVANKVAWGIPDAALAPLLALQAEFVGLYNIIKDKKNRTSSQVAAFHDCRRRFAAAWRAFHKEWVAYNSAISQADMTDLVGKEYDREPSPHPAIEQAPIIGLRVLPGGDIEVRARATTDATRASMLRAATLIDFRYCLLDMGDIPPGKADDFPKRDISSRALFVIKAGEQNAGKHFWGVFRWLNNKKPRIEGPWTEAISVVIA